MISKARLPIQDGVGTVGYTIYGPDLVEVSARTTANIQRMFEGDSWAEYAAVVTLPDGVTEGLILWDTGSGDCVLNEFNATGRSITFEVN